MAGTDPNFNRAEVEEGIRFAMRLGLHPDPAERPTFHFAAIRTWPEGTVLSQDGKSLDPSVRPVVERPAPQQVLCAYEYIKADEDELPVGVTRDTKVVLTLLEAEYQEVSEATEVEIGKTRYKLGYEMVPRGLFDMGVRQFACFAKDES